MNSLKNSKWERLLYSRSLHWFPEYEVMEQSQVKPSHCCMQTPWLAHESSWQVVLGPRNAHTEGRRRKSGERSVKNESSSKQSLAFTFLMPQNIQRHDHQKCQLCIMQRESNIYKRRQKYTLSHKLSTVTHRRERAEHTVLCQADFAKRSSSLPFN